MIIALFKKDIKMNYKLLLIFCAIFCLYIPLIIGMYSKEAQESLTQILASFPKEMIAAMGFNVQDTTLMGFITTYLYGFLVLIFPMLFSVILANKLVCQYVDSGAMAYLLATPHKRSRIIITQLIFILLMITLLMAFITILEIICVQITFPGVLSLSSLLVLNLAALILHILIACIAFCASSVFNESKTSLFIGAGIPILSFLFQMLANMGGNLEFFKYLTFFTLFNPNKIVESSSNAIIPCLAMGGMSILLTCIAVQVFSRKNMNV